METVVDEFVTVQAGQPFRLLRFGTLVKNGRKRNVTPELAARFSLPHFKPPLKLGSHKDEAPAGGHIVALEVRDDGLWALPEWNEEGADAVRRGAFRYQSPEIIWEGAIEDPDNGQPIQAPLIVGAALLHTPHLGEAAALYTSEEMTMTENEQVSVGMLERLWSLFGRTPQIPVVELTTEPVAETDMFAVELAQIKAERDELSARLTAIETERERMAAHTARVEQFATELAETPLAEDAPLHELLAGLGDDVAAALLTRLKALAAQSRVAELTADVGRSDNQTGGSPMEVLEATIAARRSETSDDYIAALNWVRQTRPALIEAVYG